MSWGKNVTDELFRHFVLPIRVNNENLDDSRKVFYGELKERVKAVSYTHLDVYKRQALLIRKIVFFS